MKIQPVAPDDLSLLPDLQPAGWVDIVPVFDFYTMSGFCFPVKVMIDDTIAGIGCTIIHNDVAWLAHIIVHPDHRCRGLGRLITQALINRARENGCSTIYLIATALGEPVYRKEGFIIETEYLFYKDIPKANRTISGHIRPYENRYRDHFSSFDKRISGEDRMMHLEKHLTDALMYCNGDTPEGYYLPSLGEGMITADSECAGIGLLKLHLNHKNSIVIPKENITAQTFLQEAGAKEIRIMKRMRLGPERTVGFENIYNRIGGNAG